MALGWKKAIKKVSDDVESEEPINKDQGNIPQLIQGHAVKLITTQTDSLKTQPPARFTEGSLITAMKSIAKYVDNPQLKKVLKDTAGIGTEATRANILETLVNREYIQRKGKQVISTAKGRELIQLLPQSITNPATTALWEQILDNIASGQGGIADFLDDQEDAVSGMLEQLASLGQKKKAMSPTPSSPCPECGQALIRRKGKKGYWWGCSSYPTCKTTFLDNNGKPKIQSINKKERGHCI